MLKYMDKDSDDGREKPQNGDTGGSNNAPSGVSDAAHEQAVQPEQQQNGDYLTVHCNDNKIKRGTIVLTILFLISLGCVLLMIKKSSPSKAVGKPTTEELKIESAISQITGLKMDGNNQLDQMVRRFNQFSDVEKLQIEHLQKNPFIHEKYMPTIVLSSEGDGTELARQAQSMQLITIMQSSEGNCCMIDDKILYEGDKIGGFLVCRINDYSVELCTSDGMKFTLKIPREF